jgi:ParB family chromosome partitioning protein
MVKNKGLGKGLRALIPDNIETSNLEKVKEADLEKMIFHVKTSNLRPNPEQPRKSFEREKLEELGASIKEYGIIQPILVKPEGKGYTIIAGERRWRAATIIGLKEIPVIVKDLPPDEVLEIALIENVQRENLNSIEEALAYDCLMTQFNLTQGEIGIRIGKSRTAVANTLRLLKLPKMVQNKIIQKNLSSGHGRALLVLEESSKIEAFAKEISEQGLSVRETEKRIKKIQLAKEKDIIKPQLKIDQSPYIKAIEEGLSYQLRRKVKLNSRGASGKIEINYTSLEDLDELLSKLGYLGKEN